MRRRTKLSLLILVICIPVMVLSLLSWMAEGGAIANALFQAAGSVAAMTAFFGILYPAVARWALRRGGTTGRAYRSPLFRFMAGLDERDL